MPVLIVFTCASGKQCSHIIPSFDAQKSLYRLRLVVHSKQSKERLQNQYPEADVLQANLNSPEDCARILEGASTIYYVSPTFQPLEAQYGINIINAAIAESRKAGTHFAHFVFSSVLHPELSKLLNHDRKRLIEEYLCESSLSYTILQPSHFMDNSIGRLIALKDSPEPVFTAFHNPDIAFSYSCLRDHAAVSVKVIHEGSTHYFATYQLASTRPMTYRQYVKAVGDVIDKDVKIRQTSFDETVNQYADFIFGPIESRDQRNRDGPERLILYYDQRGIIGNPRVTEWLLGRPPTSPADLARILLADSDGDRA